MLTDQELQSLRNQGNEARDAADEIVRLRANLKSVESLAGKAQAYADERLAAAVSAERQRCATICDELEAIWTALKDAALLNGDIALSNAHAGEPRAARLIKAQILGA